MTRRLAPIDRVASHQPDSIVTRINLHNALMKPLHARSKIFQWAVALVFLMVFVALVLVATFGVIFLLGWRFDDPAELGLALLVHVLLLLPLWMLLTLFLMAPLFRLTGVLRYYSPYLILSRSGRNRIDLHGATPFDYLLLFRWRDRGRPAVRRILLWYVEGLIALAREIEGGRFPIDTTVSATSYIFSASTARRYGFTVDEAPRWACGGFLTYPTQFLTYSFSQARWSLPPVHRARKATIKGADLCSQIARLERVQKRLRDARLRPRGDLAP